MIDKGDGALLEVKVQQLPIQLLLLALHCQTQWQRGQQPLLISSQTALPMIQP